MSTMIAQDSLCARLSAGQLLISVPGSFDLAAAAVEGFGRFLEETPAEERKRWTFNVFEDNEDPDGAPDDGYLPLREGQERKVSGGRYDAKEVFHYRRRLLGLLTKRGVVLTPKQREWFLTCQELHRRVFNAIFKAAGEIDAEFPELGLGRLMRHERSMALHCIRLIRYARRGPEDPLIIGKRHRDRCGITGQIGESHPGLRIYPEGEEGPAVPYRAEKDHILVFPGMKMEVLSNGEIPALPHDIVTGSAVSPPRWSVIAFAHIPLSLLASRS